jgi:hypothetical protein
MHTHTYTHTHIYVSIYIHTISSRDSRARCIIFCSTQANIHTYTHTCIHTFSWFSSSLYDSLRTWFDPSKSPAFFSSRASRVLTVCVHMYVCMHASFERLDCVCVCMHAFFSSRASRFLTVCVHMYVCVYACIPASPHCELRGSWLYVCICMYVCMYVHMHSSLLFIASSEGLDCLSVCMYACMYAYTHTHTRARAHTHVYTRKYIHTLILNCLPILIALISNQSLSLYTHIYMHAHIHSLLLNCLPILIALSPLA